MEEVTGIDRDRRVYPPQGRGGSSYVFEAQVDSLHETCEPITLQGFGKPEEAVFKSEDDEFIFKTSGTVEGVKSLVEAGYSYVREFDGFKLFKKRK